MNAGIDPVRDSRDLVGLSLSRGVLLRPCRALKGATMPLPPPPALLGSAVAMRAKGRGGRDEMAWGGRGGDGGGAVGWWLMGVLVCGVAGFWQVVSFCKAVRQERVEPPFSLPQEHGEAMALRRINKVRTATLASLALASTAVLSASTGLEPRRLSTPCAFASLKRRR